MGAGQRTSFFRNLLVVFCLITTNIGGSALQLCGQDLANALSIVCAENGYNKPFRQDPYGSPGDDQSYMVDMGRRMKRGIVDECCRTTCSWSTIESYCSPSTYYLTNGNLQIRKRSDPSPGAPLSRSARTDDNLDGLAHFRKRLFGSTPETVWRKQTQVFQGDAGETLENQIRNHLVDTKLPNQTEKRPVKYLTNGKNRLQPNLRAEDQRPKIEVPKIIQVGTIPKYFFGKTLVSSKTNWRHPSWGINFEHSSLRCIRAIKKKRRWEFLRRVSLRRTSPLCFNLLQRRNKNSVQQTTNFKNKNTSTNPKFSLISYVFSKWRLKLKMYRHAILIRRELRKWIRNQNISAVKHSQYLIFAIL